MPHSTVARPGTPEVLPPFPDSLPQAPIQRISLQHLIDRDPAAEKDLWDACTSHGFFYLDCTSCNLGRSIVRAADELEKLSHPAFRLPTEVKQNVAVSKMRTLFGYKGPGNVAQDDPHKRRDFGEFWNVSKDDVLGQSEDPVPYPSILQEAHPLFEGFMRNAHGVGLLVMELLAGRLGIPPEQLTSKHKLQGRSGDHVRLTFGPGDPEAANTETMRTEAETKITTYAHTDFGSVTLLFNWLGGLQIENRASGVWEWVKPVPGHAICNLGDAMHEFAGGKVSSGKHRVVAAPSAQAAYDRYSVVYFVRPEDDVVLEDLTPGAVPKPEGQRWTAGEWIDERSRQLGNTIKQRTNA
ncbi:hypothetical protein DL766_004543 [Monosporascus sp. MC13-8B]|uniref:Fe2OG dioxygenase domain-containing protein n=1 Tax=Monosporascus cannonballus TaxID=155416 RepID=A0ABY0HMD5_9PEZI|nr:hypothetical protein DL763_005731 [Monosporascus cannonballus]RYO94161.1 hypothetical protein DL762_000671 [Monosporascus cannonballus]RYP31113.1 hypothetical protein DL766_004543 [Monosporascus sp. MC13-8B]